MTQLSPAAQTVLYAFLRSPCDNRLAVAATLRAAADQVVPEEAELVADQKIRWKLLSIANELENK